MALETVTFTLADFGGVFDDSIELRVVFRPNGAATGGSGISHSRPIIVDDFGPGGTASVQLQSTDALWRIDGTDVYYEVSIERLVSGADWFPFDHTGWKLRVPPGGGAFAALVRAPANPRQIWFGPTPPEDPGLHTGWYNTAAPIGADNYFEWEE